MNPLTDRQRQVLLAIYDHCQAHGRTPRCEDIAARLNISKGGAHLHLRLLAKKGVLPLAQRGGMLPLPLGLRLVPEFTGDEDGQRLRELIAEARAEEMKWKDCGTHSASTSTPEQ